LSRTTGPRGRHLPEVETVEHGPEQVVVKATRAGQRDDRDGARCVRTRTGSKCARR
jgi:hypothetical protein